MFVLFLLQLFLGGFLVEAFTQLVVKSELFAPLRRLAEKLGFFGKPLTCGYCFSFWAAAGVVLLGLFSVRLVYSDLLNFVLLVLATQRTSNIMHNCIDKFTDKYYSTMHINSDKEF